MIRTVGKLHLENAMKMKPYEKPVIVSSESMETRAVICTKSDPAACGAGGTLSN